MLFCICLLNSFLICSLYVFFFKQKTAYEMRISDWSSDVCSSDLAARDHPTVLFFGLALSVTLMAVAANLIARIIERYHWIAYIGLAVILYVAGSMIFDGWVDPEIGVGHLFRAWI